MNDAIYILGLFENQGNPLWKFLKEEIQKSIKINIQAFELYGSVDEFASYSFEDEVKRLNNVLQSINPSIAIGHSLGAYVLAQIPINCPLVLLEPSLSIKDMVGPNIKKDDGITTYNDGHYKFTISEEFLLSLEKTPAIEEIPFYIKTKDISIFGAEHGGHKIAEM